MFDIDPFGIHAHQRKLRLAETRKPAHSISWPKFIHLGHTTERTRRGRERIVSHYTKADTSRYTGRELRILRRALGVGPVRKVNRKSLL
jgi:hypothetical protein